MMRSFRQLIASLLLCWLLPAAAAEPVKIEGAWARSTAPGQEVGAAYMQLTSQQAYTVVKVESPAADFVEIHMMKMRDGKMEMRMLEELALPAGKTVKLEPGGFHLMLIDLKRPLQEGETLPVTLHLKDADGKASSMTVQLPVRKSRPN